MKKVFLTGWPLWPAPSLDEIIPWYEEEGPVSFE